MFGRTKRMGLLAAALLFVAGPGRAADERSTSERRGSEEAEATEGRLSIVVTADRPTRPGSDRLGGEALEAGPAPDLSEVLVRLPGVSAVRRGGAAGDPVIRGLSGERVRTRVGVVPVFGACPSRMDPPVTYLSPLAVDSVVVSRGLVPMDVAGGATGGAIVVDPVYWHPQERPPGARGFVGASYDVARAGFLAEAGVEGGTERASGRLTVGVTRLGDYTSGGGATVPANEDDVSAGLSLAFRPSRHQRFWHALSYVEERDVDYPALPMNLDRSTVLHYNAGWRADELGPVLRSVQTRAGFSWVDHVMSNRGKPNRATMEAETPSQALSLAADARVGLRPFGAADLTLGLDVTRLAQDATRTRRMVPAPASAMGGAMGGATGSAMGGATLYDRIWPAPRQLDVALFADLAVPLPLDLGLTVGARVDAVRSGADIDDLLTGYERFATPSGAAEETEVLGAGAAFLTWAPHAALEVHAGGAFTMRAAGPTERYFAFAPMPGGFRVGNPWLEPEKKAETQAGVRASLPWLDASLTGFYAHVADYVLETGVATEDVNGDGTVDRVAGYRNVDAWLAGVEFGAEVRPLPWLRFPLALAWIHGRNATDDRALPLVPPIEGRAAARVELTHGLVRWWVEVGTRFAAARDDVDPALPEDPTDAWVLLDARAGALLWERLRLEVAATNLLDADYHDHLARTVPLAVGDLSPGADVPALGRRFLVTGRYTF